MRSIAPAANRARSPPPTPYPASPATASAVAGPRPFFSPRRSGSAAARPAGGRRPEPGQHRSKGGEGAQGRGTHHASLQGQVGRRQERGRLEEQGQQVEGGRPAGAEDGGLVMAGGARVRRVAQLGGELRPEPVQRPE